jgi:hypothetical protein
MEHRCSRRHEVDLKALIYKRGTPVAIGRIKNGSQGGLFVTTDYANVSEHQKLELVVMMKRTPQEPKRYQLKTLVVHKTDGGLGLELEIADERDSGELFEMIRTAQMQKQVQPMEVMRQKAQA